MCKGEEAGAKETTKLFLPHQKKTLTNSAQTFPLSFGGGVLAINQAPSVQSECLPAKTFIYLAFYGFGNNASHWVKELIYL